MLESNRSHEWQARHRAPRRDKAYGGDHNDVERRADNDRREDSARESLRAELRVGFLGRLGHRFVSRHVVRHNLEHQQNERNGVCVNKGGKLAAIRG